MDPVMAAQLPHMLASLGEAFMVFVAPVWLGLHYWRGGTKIDTQRLEGAVAALSANAQRLEARVASLETALLDAEQRYRV